MKKLFLKLISLLLVTATLLPMLVACDNDPDDDDDKNNPQNPSGGETDMENYYFKLNTVSKVDSVLVDFTEQAFKDKNAGLSNSITEKDGRPVLKWYATNQLDAVLPEVRTLEYCTSVRFSVYSEEATGTVVEVGFVNTKKPLVQWSAVARITIDFVGWKSFDIPSNMLSGYGARDQSVAQFRLKANKNSDNSQPDDILYITNVDITTESYSVTAPEGVDINDTSLYTSITQKVKETIVGNADVAETEEFKSKLASINNNCKSAMALYNKYKAAHPNEDVENELFDIVVEKVYFSGEEATNNFYNKVLAMAIAYGAIGSEYYQSEEVFAAIVHSLEYAYKYYYGPSLLEEGVYGNWWQWYIGTPIALTKILVIIEDKITPELCAKYLTVFDYLVPYPSQRAGNKIWVSRLCIISAALRRDALDLCIDTYYMNDLFDYIDNYVEDEGGFFADGSFIQHSNYAYTSGYGGNYLGDLPEMLYYLSGSRFYPQQENVNNHYTWIIDGIRPVIYEKCFMAAMNGRGVTRNTNESSVSCAAKLILVHYYAPDNIKAELEPIIAYFMQLYKSDFSKNVAYSLINYAKELYARLKDVEVEPYEITRIFGMMARVVHQGPEYGVCLSLSNTNVGKYESINNENRCGWYHGDGMLQIYTDGYGFDVNYYSFANPYLMPGTTANSAERLRNHFYSPITNASNYAGGASNGKYGAVGFILDYEDGASVNNGSEATFKNEKDNTIYAKKSYFFFDNEIVCVGSDISDKSGTDVKTVIENRYWRTTGETLTIGNSVVNAPATVETEINERVIHFTNMGGYVILKDDGAKLIYKKATNEYNNATNQTGTLPAYMQGTRDFFELYLNHGTGNTESGKLTSNSYFYAYLPEATAEETATYYENPDVELLKRTSSVHAVIEKKLGIVACNFFIEDGDDGATLSVQSKYSSVTAVKSINASTPCSVMITKNGDGSYTVSVSDPTQEYRQTTLSIEIEGVSTVVSSDGEVKATIDGGNIDVVVDTSAKLGQTYTFTVR